LTSFTSSLTTTVLQVVGVTDGPITDIVVVDQNAIVALPDGLTDTEAAALPMLSLAAWLALVETVRILDGYTILIHDASSRT
jgi:NADPH:quinone reductase-like Zn-dependent oxidoreductase